MAERPFRLRTCRSIREQLSAFLDDEVGDNDAMDIARHVSRCEECSAELEDVRAAREALRSLPPLPAPAGLAAPPNDDGPAMRRGSVAGLGVAAAMLVLAGLFAAGEPTGEIVPPVDSFVVDHVTNTGGDPVLTPVRLDR